MHDFAVQCQVDDELRAGGQLSKRLTKSAPAPADASVLLCTAHCSSMNRSTSRVQERSLRLIAPAIQLQWNLDVEG